MDILCIGVQLFSVQHIRNGQFLKIRVNPWGSQTAHFAIYTACGITGNESERLSLDLACLVLTLTYSWWHIYSAFKQNWNGQFLKRYNSQNSQIANYLNSVNCVMAVHLSCYSQNAQLSSWHIHGMAVHLFSIQWNWNGQWTNCIICYHSIYGLTMSKPEADTHVIDTCVSEH